MDCKSIEQLLEHYWNGETSLSEEKALRDFFLSEDVPAHLIQYKEIFVYQRLQEEVRISDDFEQRILAQVEMPVVKARKITFVTRFMPIAKAAAAVAVVLLLGNLAQRSLPGNDKSVMAADTIGKQVTTPSVAISDGVQLGHGQLADSLKKESKVELMNK